jgi:hypothetical protein
MVNNYNVFEVGSLQEWGRYVGGLSPQTQAPGRKFLEQDLSLDFFGVSINSRKPGEGELALDEAIVPV